MAERRIMSSQISEQVLPKDAEVENYFCEEAEEYYRTLLRQLDWPGNGSSRVLRTLGLTSCCGEEGVSTIAAHLAATAASWGDYRILLVDTNLVRPAADRIFDVDQEPGIADVLAGTTGNSKLHAEEEMVVDDDLLIAALQPSDLHNLTILTSGRPIENPAWIYDSTNICSVVEMLETRFDLIVFDMPAVEEASSITRLASRLDGVLLVIEAERVGSDVVSRASRFLSQANVHLLGAVLNKRRSNASGWL
jgi:capsular exopolysaccharide synthesis family protein